MSNVTSSPSLNAYFTTASSIVSPSPSPSTSPTTDADMKIPSSRAGITKRHRVDELQVARPKRRGAIAPMGESKVLAVHGADRATSDKLAQTFKKIATSPPPELVQLVNRTKIANDRRITLAQLTVDLEEYKDEIWTHLKEMEAMTMASPELMDQQTEINWEMRPCLVDFMVEVHSLHRMRPETLYLAMNVLDRYLSKRQVHKKHYQLVGCASLWLAAKYEDGKDRVPLLNDLVDVCRATYAGAAFTQMEAHVLHTVNWALGHPTAEVWMRMRCMGDYWESPRTQHVARFLMELTLYKRQFIHFLSSSIAMGALILAKYILNEPRGRHEDTVDPRLVAEMLDAMLFERQGVTDTVVRKYAPAYYSHASQVVLEWYGRGRRFEPFLITAASLPATPNQFPKDPNMPSRPLNPEMADQFVFPERCSPMSASSSSASSAGDSMPPTPLSALFPGATGSYPLPGTTTVDGKENQHVYAPVANAVFHPEPLVCDSDDDGDDEMVSEDIEDENSPSYCPARALAAGAARLRHKEAASLRNIDPAAVYASLPCLSAWERQSIRLVNPHAPPA